MKSDIAYPDIMFTTNKRHCFSLKPIRFDSKPELYCHICFLITNNAYVFKCSFLACSHCNYRFKEYVSFWCLLNYKSFSNQLS